jgi:protein phosphatase
LTTSQEKGFVETRLHGKLTIREENSIAALEVMSRFAVNPKWLIYLPPTMSPSETTNEPGLLEHPAEALEYFRKAGVEQVVCEQKHMGSRAVVIICRSREVARQRFGIAEDEFGVCYTRTGRRFFADPVLEREFLTRVQSAVEKAELWDELRSDWLCLDCELMPWSAKAQELLKQQYAPTGAAARAGLRQAIDALKQTSGRQEDAKPLLEWFEQRLGMAEAYVDSYRRYCWPVNSLLDMKLAPFHLLASEGALHIDKDHVWHMQTLARLSQSDPELILATPFKVVQLNDPASVADAITWWQELTAAGGEGMVVKPFAFTARNKRGLIQPAVKCRGKEYLRIIYGPEYTAPHNLERLRPRGLSTKRSLALREFALGIEALQRFVEREPLRRVHECVFGVLALESEPVDPRL